MNPNSSVFTELSAWRRKKASSEHKVPYLIANNRLLLLLSVFLPQNEDELLQIPGMGMNKVEEYGDELVNILRVYERTTAFPLDWVEEQIEEEHFRTWIYKQKETKFKSEKLRYNLRQNILQGIEEGLDIGQLSANTDMDRRDFVRQLEELEKMGCSVEKLIVIELSDVSQEEQQMVWNLYEEIGDAFLKPVLQRIYGNQLEGIPEGLALETLYERLRLIRIRYRRN
ncbi:ATP-dependent DNA helicase UvrD2 [compost metagenome]